MFRPFVCFMTQLKNKNDRERIEDCYKVWQWFINALRYRSFPNGKCWSTLRPSIDDKSTQKLVLEKQNLKDFL